MNKNNLLLILGLFASGWATSPTWSAPVKPPAQRTGMKGALSTRSWTFAVLGDNRGDSDGMPSPAFVRVLQEVKKSAPAFVLNTGDMINGYAGEDATQLRRMWKGYWRAVKPLNLPFYHIPGNHDLFDATSAQVYREQCGAPYYTFTAHDARFIGLDTETLPGRLDGAQWSWLESQLKNASEPHLFIFLHQPLFPVDGHIGSSLDVFPADRDRLHQLFIRYRARIGGVFLGHEHLYHFERRDGVPYYIIGGGGAPLYVPPEIGGFYHYVIVSISGGQVSTQVRRVELRPRARPQSAARLVLPGQKLESWENRRFSYSWDQSVTRHSVTQPVSHGRRSLRLDFDFAQYDYPFLSLPLHPLLAVQPGDRIDIDIYVPPRGANGLSVVPGVVDGDKTFNAPTIPLKAGWNTVAMRPSDPWLPSEVRPRIERLQWVLMSKSKAAGWVAFDNLRVRGETNTALSDFESPLLWGVWDESVQSQMDPRYKTEGTRGRRLDLDFARYPYPRLYGKLEPHWNLSRVPSLLLDVFVPPETTGLRTGLAIRSHDESYDAPPVALKAGWNHIKVALGAAWLPPAARADAMQIDWNFRSSGTHKAWLVVDNLRAGTQRTATDGE